MYVDITSVAYNNNKKKGVSEVIVTGTDLDSILLNDWSKEFNTSEVNFRFDLTAKGPRIYLYKLLKSQVKEECKSMEEMLMALNGRIINISSNFLTKAEG